MKKIITIAVLLLTFICASAQNGKSIYQKYSEVEGVSAVYISPAMFRIMGKLPDLNVEGENVNLAPVIKTLTGLYMINTGSGQVSAKMMKDVDRFISSGHYELLMEAKESGELMRMYTVGTEEIVDSFVMIADDKSETTFICLDGKMNRAELEKVLAEKMEE